MNVVLNGYPVCLRVVSRKTCMNQWDSLHFAWYIRSTVTWNQCTAPSSDWVNWPVRINYRKAKSPRSTAASSLPPSHSSREPAACSLLACGKSSGTCHCRGIKWLARKPLRPRRKRENICAPFSPHLLLCPCLVFFVLFFLNREVVLWTARAPTHL